MNRNSTLSKDLLELLGLISSSLGSLHSRAENLATQSVFGPPLYHLQEPSPPLRPPEPSEDGKPSSLWGNDTFAQFLSIVVVHFDFPLPQRFQRMSPCVDPQRNWQRGVSFTAGLSSPSVSPQAQQLPGPQVCPACPRSFHATGHAHRVMP